MIIFQTKFLMSLRQKAHENMQANISIAYFRITFHSKSVLLIKLSMANESPLI